jgi:cytochrome c553
LFREAALRAFVLGLVLVALSLGSSLGQTFEERLSLCLACHGEKGASETAEVPSLGGQPSAYTLIQLFMFRQKLRIAAPMNDMADGLSDAELQKFADTVAKLPGPQGAEADPARLGGARALVAQHRCGFCHNADFSGNDSVPRLAGQREDYLLKALREYKAGTRTEYQPIMAEVLVPLRDADFVELAYFLSHAR